MSTGSRSKSSDLLLENIPGIRYGYLYSDELASLPNYAGPLHWHPYFEIATAMNGVLDYQVRVYENLCIQKITVKNIRAGK